MPKNKHDGRNSSADPDNSSDVQVPTLEYDAY